MTEVCFQSHKPNQRCVTSVFPKTYKALIMSSIYEAAHVTAVHLFEIIFIYVTFKSMLLDEGNKGFDLRIYWKRFPLSLA